MLEGRHDALVRLAADFGAAHALGGGPDWAASAASASATEPSDEGAAGISAGAAPLQQQGAMRELRNTLPAHATAAERSVAWSEQPAGAGPMSLLHESPEVSAAQSRQQQLQRGPSDEELLTELLQRLRALRSMAPSHAEELAREAKPSFRPRASAASPAGNHASGSSAATGVGSWVRELQPAEPEGAKAALPLCACSVHQHVSIAAMSRGYGKEDKSWALQVRGPGCSQRPQTLRRRRRQSWQKGRL